MLDFNNEEEQRERNYGPVPAGSRVLVRLELQTPKYADSGNPRLARTQKGLLQLFCKLTVAAGSYAGCFWYENITLPGASQRIMMDEKQKLSARIGGALVRAIVESCRRIDPKATDDHARRGRCINSWEELNGMEFPCRLGIDKKPYTGSDGREYWNNRISSVLSCKDREFGQITAGGEIITDGPVCGKPVSNQASQANTAPSAYGTGAEGNPPGQPQYGEGGMLSNPGHRYESAPYDDVPF